MALESTLLQLRAAADRTRLRLLALVAAGEASVGELARILQQSQPRVSRHLKILSDAGLVSRFRDGQSVYYRLAGGPGSAGWLRQVLDQAGAADPVMRADAGQMGRLRRLREAAAIAAGRQRIGYWSGVAGGRPDDTGLRDRLDEILGTDMIGDLLDVGTGSGTVLRLLAGRARLAVGVDSSRSMRLLARARLHQAGLGQCTVRDGDVHALPFADQSFDLVVLDEVLGQSPRPARAVEEAYRVLRYAGRLLILDRVLPVAQKLSGRTSGRQLFENQLRALLRGSGFSTGKCLYFAGKSPEYALTPARKHIVAMSTGTHD